MVEYFFCKALQTSWRVFGTLKKRLVKFVGFLDPRRSLDFRDKGTFPVLLLQHRDRDLISRLGSVAMMLLQFFEDLCFEGLRKGMRSKRAPKFVVHPMDDFFGMGGNLLEVCNDQKRPEGKDPPIKIEITSDGDAHGKTLVND